ncbi:MAG: PAS domain S-box protein [Elusimicrobiota bacterium]|jgi:PAS domain S-box-containing protein
MGSKDTDGAQDVLASYLESSGDVFYRRGPDQLLTYVSPQVKNLFGYEPREILGKTWTGVATDNPLNAHAEAATQKAFSTGLRQPPYEVEIRDKSGQTRWLGINETPISREGKVVALVGWARDVTGHRSVEAALEASESRYRTLVDSTDTGFVVIDGQGIVLEANEPYLRLVGGRHRDEVIGHSVVEWTAPEEKDNNAAAVALCARQGFIQDFETVYLRHDGTRVNILINANIQERGGRRQLASLCRNITERKRGEEQMRDSEAFFRAISDNMLSGVHIIQDGVFKHVNPALGRMLGYEVAEMLGHDPLGFVHPQDRDLVSGHIRRRLAGEEASAQYCFRCLHKDGRVLDVEALGSKLRYRGRPAVIGNIMDITERRRTEAALRESAQKIRAVFDQSFQFIGIVQPDGTLIEANQAALKFAGITAEQVLGKPFWQTPWWTHSPELQAKLREAVVRAAGGEALRFEATHRAADGSLRDVDFSLKPIKDDSGRVTMMIPEGRDITDIKRMEQELLQMRKIESLGVLAGGIAHDFNNILTAIMGNISLARIQLPESHPVSEILGDALYATHSAQGLAQQLLTFARGGLPVKLAFDLGEMVRNTAVFAARGSNVKCVFEFGAGLWPVHGDEGQLQQVVQNLVLNAMQAMPEGGQISISAANEDLRDPGPLPLAPGRYVKLSVADQGGGIPSEHLSKVFDPYFTTKGKGWGLGLSMVYSVVKKHGGHVTAESPPGGGSRFHAYLVAADAAPDAPAKAKAKLPSGHGRILVMDDEDMVKNILCLMLKRMGYAAESVHDGAGAIKAYEQARAAGQPFDAVIMDLTISGGMGGKDAVKRLRQLDPAAKVIVSSGYSNDPILSDHSAFGFDAVLLKPYQFEDLAKIIAGVLSS